MKLKVIKAKDYLLLVDEEAEIKEEKLVVRVYEDDIRVAKSLPNSDNLKRLKDKRVFLLIAYHPLNSEAKELDLPLLPVTPKDKWGVHETHCCEKHGCKYGDNDCCVAIGIAKAKYPCEYCDDDENDKQFSLEDMKKAIEMAREGNFSKYYGCMDWVNSEEEIIQSLSTQQLPKEFVPEIIIINRDYRFNEGQREELKIITNSEGKQELVGTWKF